VEAYVGSFAAAFGSQRASVEESAEAGRLISPKEALLEAGFRQHHMCADDESAYDLAVRCVDGMGSDLPRVDAIVYANCLPQNANAGSPAEFDATGDVKHLMDFPASRLQAHLHADDSLVIGLTQQACTGVLGSLRIAKMLLATEPGVENVLCITADRFPPGALYEQAYNLISDGAASCIVSRQPGPYRLLSCHSLTNGALAAASDEETVGTYFNYTHRVIVECIERAGLSVQDIDWAVPQNLSSKAWQILARFLGLSMERVHMGTLASAGHMISGDNILNMMDLDRTQKVEPGARLLLTMAGYGLNWQSVILEKA